MTTDVQVDDRGGDGAAVVSLVGLSPNGSEADVEIGFDTTSGLPVSLRYADRDRGVAIVGKSGTGKTELLKRMALSDLSHHIPTVVIDPHGQLAEEIVKSASSEDVDRIILLEAVKSKPFGLNLLELRDPVDDDDDPFNWAVANVIATVKKLYHESDVFSPRLERTLRRAARTLIPGGYTLADIPGLFDDKAFRQACIAAIGSPKERKRVTDQWNAFDKLRPSDRDQQSEPLLNRVDLFDGDSVLNSIVGSQHTTVPYDKVLSGDSMLIVRLPSEHLTPEQCDFIGAIVLSGLADRIFARRLRSKPPRLHLYLDEYQRFATITTATLLSQGRKYGAGVTLAHQDLSQIRDAKVRNAALQAGTLISTGAIWPDAQVLAGEFSVKSIPERLDPIEVEDGTKPVYIFSPTPADDIYLDGHPDKLVDLAGKSFIEYTSSRVYFNHEAGLPSGGPTVGRAVRGAHGSSVPSIHPRPVPSPRDKRKSVDVPRRPGGVSVDPRAQRRPQELNELLVEAMNDSRFTDPAHFADEMLKHDLFYAFPQKSHELRSDSDCSVCTGNAETGYENFAKSIGGHLASPASTPGNLQYQQELTALYESERDYLLNATIRRWLNGHLQHADALKHGNDIRAFEMLDHELRSALCSSVWMQPADRFSYAGYPCLYPLFEWHGRTVIMPDGSRAVAISQTGWRPWTKIAAIKEMIGVLRERVRWLWILCEGVCRVPLWIPSGAQEPRMVKRYIPRAKQTHSDALSEFAGRLAGPGEFIAHVKSPQGHYETQLLDVVRGLDDESQLDEVRRQSHKLYAIPPRAETSVVADTADRHASKVRPPVIHRGPGRPDINPRPPSPTPRRPKEVPATVEDLPTTLTLATPADPPTRGTPRAAAKAPVTHEPVPETVGGAGAAVVRGDSLVVEAEVFEDLADEVATAALPAVRDCICLEDYLTTNTTSRRPSPRSRSAEIDLLLRSWDLNHLRTYRWWSEEEVARAVKCVEAAITAHGLNKHDQVALMASSIVRIYHYDRAARVAAALPDAVSPVERHDLQNSDLQDPTFQTFMRSFPACLYVEEFNDKRHKAPLSTVGSIATAISVDPPDKIAYMEYRNDCNYETASVRYFARICAQYGEWYVQLAFL